MATTLRLVPGPNAARRPSPLTPEQRELVTMGLPLVEHTAAYVARHYRGLVVREELLGPGTIALSEAAIRYREDRHPSFLQYAKHHVHGRILDAVRTEHFSLRARVEHAMERAYARFSSHQTLDVDLFRDPEEKLVEGAARGCDDALAAAFLAGLREARTASPEEQVVELEGYLITLASLEEAMATLYPHEREVIERVYDRSMTLDEVGDDVGVHESTAQRRHVSALGKLRARLVGPDS